MKKNPKQTQKNKLKEPTFAPGSDLDQDASIQDVNKGNYTKVVKAVYDEVDPS
ncbi:MULTISPECIES: hypothetical protein [Desulfitobacterium]|uniref:Uncharacterized protein n=1 Tax=Desulfitobacterium dehalogenans (strain ATCC 51507 / DSM 9161 / JW/IU-DC1) TaxID=756499 RepID=I4A4R8_DESDJ|nr:MULTISPECIES: hypothetical protein [Desulfitobacterium]AFL98952.1 hypothetical protein Desde_0490 [Desulfitobacterium dehalogenans ATCC 51507]